MDMTKHSKYLKKYPNDLLIHNMKKKKNINGIS